MFGSRRTMRTVPVTGSNRSWRPETEKVEATVLLISGADNRYSRDGDPNGLFTNSSRGLV
jgi:hypothetical protein